jgi:hypothetical protein
MDGAAAMATAMEGARQCNVNNGDGQPKGNGDQQRTGNTTVWKAQR